MLARQMANASRGYYSVTRNNQGLDQLEATFLAVIGNGIVSGGAVTATGGFGVELETGTEILINGVVYTLLAAEPYTANVPTDTVYLWATVTRTAAAVLSPANLDTYDITLSHNTTGVAPSASHLCIAILTTDGSGITLIEEPAGKYLPLSSQALVYPGRPATGQVRIAVNPNNADTVTLVVGADTQIYEIDTGDGVGAGNITVTKGATAADTAAALAAAIVATQMGLVTAAQHATDTTVVDVRAVKRGVAITLTESTAGARIVAQDNGEEAAAAVLYPYSATRTITAEDVVRARVRVDTGLSSILAPYPLLSIRVSSASQITVAWDGVLTVSGGIIELDNSGADAWAAGNVIDVVAWGT